MSLVRGSAIVEPDRPAASPFSPGARKMMDLRTARAPMSRTAPRISIGLLLTSILVSALGAGCVSIHLFEGGVEAPLEESVVRGESGPKILLLEIDGVIDGGGLSDSLFGSERLSMVARVREELDRARQDEQVQALLLRIDSPGGTATASEQIYTEIVRFKQERRVPVLAQMLSIAASGGYYVAMAADRVQAHPTTVTGSIGVIFSSVNVAGLMKRLGIEDQTITGGEYKDAGSPLRRLTPEERAQLQSVVDDLYARFQEIVVLGRPNLTPEKVAALANGQIFSAPQALQNGLVDRIGTLEDAVSELEGEIGVSRSRVVAYHRPSEIRRNLYTRASGGGPRLDGLSALAQAGPSPLSRLARILARPGFHYLWWPGLGD
jgi:protease-4